MTIIGVTVQLDPGARVPTYANEGDLACDLYANESGVIGPRELRSVPIGVRFHFPEGWGGILRSRSGLSKKYGVEVGAGTIDNRFRDPVSVILHNHSNHPFFFAKGDRIAQMVLTPVVLGRFTEGQVPPSGRGAFGSSGIGGDPIATVKSLNDAVLEASKAATADLPTPDLPTPEMKIERVREMLRDALNYQACFCSTCRHWKERVLDAERVLR